MKPEQPATSRWRLVDVAVYWIVIITMALFAYGIGYTDGRISERRRQIELLEGSK